MLPLASSLPASVIHGDANELNILVDEDRTRVVSLIDFGDMGYSWRVADGNIIFKMQLSRRRFASFAVLLFFPLPHAAYAASGDLYVLHTAPLPHRTRNLCTGNRTKDITHQL